MDICAKRIDISSYLRVK